MGHHCHGRGREVDESAPVLVVHEIDIAAPIDVVWQLHVEVGAWPTWQPDIACVHHACPLEPGASFDWTAAGRTLTSTVYDLAEREHVCWGGEHQGLVGVHEWRFQPTADGVRVTTRESIDGPAVEDNPELMQATLDASLRAWLHHLRKAAEARWAATCETALPHLQEAD